ncbi:MAG TPA: hypothetical protein VHX16_01620 [Chloroflexota bacterium]|nr:hypothetical protein [Chloroflexota bacterium]
MSAASFAADGASPRISVLLPLVDDRGLGLDSVRSWICNGARDPASYELVVMLNNDVACKADELQHLLRPHDQVICRDTDNELELFHLATTYARGEILFFSEGHCVADSGAIDATIGWFDSHSEAGFFALAGGISRNGLGRHEQRMFDTEFARWERSETWQRFHLRGTALRTESYVAIGGLEYRYGRFAEWLLSARLHVGGHRLLPFRMVRVHHVNCETFEQFNNSISEFGRGESLFRLEQTDRGFIRRFFGTPAEWSAALFGREAPTGAMARAVTRRMLFTLLPDTRNPALLRQDLVSIIALFRRWLWGRWILPLLLQSSLWWWKTMLRICGFGPGRHGPFLRYYETEAAMARAWFALQRKERTHRERPTLHYSVADLDEPQIFGFYEPELFEGHAFRWSSPVSAVRLSLPPRSYQGIIQLNRARALTERDHISLHLDNHPIRHVAYDDEQAQIWFDIPARLLSGDREHWLVMCSRPWSPVMSQAKDTRAHGLPVESVRIEPQLLLKEVRALRSELEQKESMIVALSAAADDRLKLIEQLRATAEDQLLLKEVKALRSELEQKESMIVGLSAAADDRLELIEQLRATAEERLRLIDDLTLAANAQQRLIEELTTVAEERLRLLEQQGSTSTDRA